MLGMWGEKYRIWPMGLGHTRYEKKQKVNWKELLGRTMREGTGNVKEGKDNLWYCEGMSRNLCWNRGHSFKIQSDEDVNLQESSIPEFSCSRT